MPTLTTPTRYTPAEIERLSDEDQQLYELVDGELRAKETMSVRANWVGTRLAFFLQSHYSPQQAVVISEQPTYCFDDERQMRRPDVALVWTSRLPDGLTDTELLIAPDFIAEVVSPRNSYDVLHDRLELYLQAGVPLAWIVDPKRRFIHAYRKDGTVSLYRAGGVMENEPGLPGLKLVVADCFPAVAPATTTG